MHIVFTGARGQVACPSVMKQRRAQTPQRQGLCSSSGRTPAREPCFGLTQPTKYQRSELRSPRKRTVDSDAALSSLHSHLNICYYRLTSLEFSFHCEMCEHVRKGSAQLLYYLCIRSVVKCGEQL